MTRALQGLALAVLLAGCAPGAEFMNNGQKLIDQGHPEEGLAQLLHELKARGLGATTQQDQRVLLVPLGGDDTYDVVRDAVADLALPLCRLEQRRHQVEELFRDEESKEHV